MSVVVALPLRARAILAAVVVAAVIGFVVLALLLRVEPAYAGLLFFWYWAGVREAKFAEMPAALIGACVGIGLAWLLQAAALSHQGPAIVAVLVLIVAAIVIDVMRLAPIAINSSAILYLTVAAAPLLQQGEVMPMMIVSVLLAAVFFGAIVAAVTALARRGGTTPA